MMTSIKEGGEMEEKLLADKCIIHDMQISPDDILEKLGPRNFFLILVIILTGITWSSMAMSSMSSAFISTDCTNCSDTKSLVDEYALHNTNIADLTTTAFMVGNMVGGLIISKAADYYGRRPVLLICLLMMTVTGTIAAFSPSVTFFAFMRFLQGIFYTGGALVGWVLGYEFTPVRLRLFTSLFFGMSWVFGYCLTAPIAYYSWTWRWLIFYVSLPHSIMAILCYFFVPESLHFLVCENRSVDVQKWIKRADKNNEILKDIKWEQIVTVKSTSSAKELFAELWEHKIFLRYSAVLIYLWICDTFIYFGLSLYSTHLAGNMYVNFVLMGVVEVPAYVFAPMAMDKFGRRPVMAGTHFLGAAAFAGLIFCPQDIRWAILFLYLLGKFAISCSFMTIYVYASEIFPTNIRNLSIGFCETLSRIGSMLSPHLSILAKLYVHLPVIVLALISFGGGALSYLLPETLNKKLPASIQESSKIRENN